MLTNLLRGPPHPTPLPIDPIGAQLAPSPHKLHRLLQHAHRPRRLHHHIEPIRVRLLDRLELGAAVPAIKLDIRIRHVQLPGRGHFETARSGKGEVRGAVEAEELGEHEAGGAGAEDEDGGGRRGGDARKAVQGAGGRLDEGGVHGRDVLEFEDLLY